MQFSLWTAIVLQATLVGVAIYQVRKDRMPLAWSIMGSINAALCLTNILQYVHTYPIHP